MQISERSCIFAAKSKKTMTKQSKQAHEAIMASMKALDEPMPSVGIFWYDPQEHVLWGVYKQEVTPKMVEDAAAQGIPYINYPKLHRQIWQKEAFRALAKNEPTRFKGDYTQIPRGRVVWEVNKFVVFVGKWAEDREEELTDLLEKEFALPYVELRYDEHWDLGHGWSGDFK